MDKQPAIQDYVDSILEASKNIEIIVVADMNSIRYAHPQREKVGKEFVGGDQKRVLEQGESYISVAVGTLGRQIRAFLPVFNTSNKQVGFVMVSKSITSYKQEINNALSIMIVSICIGLSVGAIGAFLLSDNIKKTLLGLEPDEITPLYTQRDSMLDAMHEGIIAIDQNDCITLVNNSAIKMLNLNTENIIGHNIQEVFPSCKLGDVMASGKAEYYSDHIINDTIVVINRVPIKNGDKIVGAIATFSDRTKDGSRGQGLFIVKDIVEALKGNIKVESILGQGSQFTVELPKEEDTL